MGNPYISGFPWAGGVAPGGSPAIYPAGSNPWSAGTTQDVPAYTYFTPSPTFAPTAQELNEMFAQRDQALLYNDSSIGPYRILEDITTTQGIETTTPIPGAGYNINAHTWNGSSFSTANVLLLATAAINTQVGDLMEIEFYGTLALDSSGGTEWNFLANLFVNQAGAGYVDTGVQALWGIAGVSLPPQSRFMGSPIALRGLWTIGTGHAGTFTFGINGAL